jgi:DNA-binding XRE family transcriptional regulator
MYKIAGQVRAARALLNITQAELGQLAGVSEPRITAIEAGKDCLQSTVRKIFASLEGRGITFGLDGSVNIRKKPAPFILEPGQNPSAETVQAAQAILAAAQKARSSRGGLG